MILPRPDKRRRQLVRGGARIVEYNRMRERGERLELALVNAVVSLDVAG